MGCETIERDRFRRNPGGNKALNVLFYIFSDTINFNKKICKFFQVYFDYCFIFLFRDRNLQKYKFGEELHG